MRTIKTKSIVVGLGPNSRRHKFVVRWMNPYDTINLQHEIRKMMKAGMKIREIREVIE